ncbi:MAG TPA: hypothetical protein VGD62_03505 [Acidobacteriaceae bacterium]
MRRPSAWLLLMLLLLVPVERASAISCTTQSQMTSAERAELGGSVSEMAAYAASGNTAALRSETLPSIAPQFEGIASTEGGLAPVLRGATLSIENLYLLHAEDLKSNEDEAQFFCSVPGSSLLVTVTIPQLPAGTYALAIVHGNGVAKPQQMGIILARGAKAGAAAPWQLAGFYARPLTIAGHDGVWYWTRARELGKAQQRWSAYFYYQSAAFLLTPVDLFSSPNLSKLERESAAVMPQGLPGRGTQTMPVVAGDQSFAVTSLSTDGALGGLDLVLHYNANAGNVDPVFARTQALLLMHAFLEEHAEVRANFHGLWVYAESAGHQPFAVELPMDQIQ